MKKRIITLALLLLSLILALSLCACGDDKEKGEKNDNDEAEVECEHRWVLESQKYPTCASEGEKILRCSYCSERNTVVVPTKTECNYEVSWEWYNNNSAVAIYLKCPYDSSHNYSFNGRITSKTIGGDVIQSATCQRIEIRKFTAEASYKGKTYYTEKIKEGKTTFHSSYLEKIPSGENCLDPVKHIEKCEWCGILLREYYTQDHTTQREVARYNLEDYGYCGGYVALYECECGKNSRLDINYKCNRAFFETTRESTTDSDGVEHVTQIKTCTECGLTLEEKWGDEASPCMQTTYHTSKLIINDELSFEKDIVDNAHSQLKIKINLNNYCGCDNPFQDDVLEITNACACGAKKETVSINWDRLRSHGAPNAPVISSTYTLIDVSAFMPEGVVGFDDEMVYTYDCGLCVFDGYLVVSTDVGDCIFKFISAIYNGEIIYQSKGAVKILTDEAPTDKYVLFKSRYALEEEKQVIEERLKTIFPDEEFEIPTSSKLPVIPEKPDEPEEPIEFTDEEKQMIINYLTELLNNETVDLTPREREYYQDIIDHLKNVLAKKGIR
ncbi:MAG: hypothetical protein IJD89_07300 [Clostridia bacterium]|nr:hypothetical protein [Clostridia bacterium]